MVDGERWKQRPEKLQIPSSKLQAPKPVVRSLESRCSAKSWRAKSSGKGHDLALHDFGSNAKHPLVAVGAARLGSWCLELLWSLEFEIWSFAVSLAASHSQFPPRSATGSACHTGCDGRSRTRRVSQLLTASLAQVPQRLVGEGVEPAGPNVRLKLPVPRLGIERREPPPEGRQITARELAHRCFNPLNRAHAATIETLPPAVKRGGLTPSSREAPNSKLQAPEKHQTPNSKSKVPSSLARADWVLGLGASWGVGVCH